jgi:hypothetical protein
LDVALARQFLVHLVIPVRHRGQSPVRCANLILLGCGVRHEVVSIENILMEWLVRPIWRPLRARILGPIEARIGALEADRASIVSKTNAVGSELIVMNRKLESARHELQASVALHSSRQLKSINDMWERIEFMRQEMLFEMKYGNSKNPETVTPHILGKEKFEAAKLSGLRFNLGCGHIPMSDYVNVDSRELPHVDIIAEAGDLPVQRGTVKEIFSAHLLEHFPQEELRRRLLPYWHNLLAPGGTFHAVVPDGEAMLAGLAAGTYAFEDFREVLFGGQDYAGDFHFNLFTPESLSSLLAAAGFCNIRVLEKGRRNGKCFEFEISAAKAEISAYVGMNDMSGATPQNTAS